MVVQYQNDLDVLDIDTLLPNIPFLQAKHEYPKFGCFTLKTVEIMNNEEREETWMITLNFKTS